MMADKQSETPFYETLAHCYGDWIPLFQRWEPLHRRVEELRRERDLAKQTHDRERQLWRLDKEIAEALAEIQELQPFWRFMWSDAAVVVDCWLEFVHAWRNLQLQHGEAVNPQGKPLSKSPAAEKEAWRALIFHMLPKEKSHETA